MIHLLSHGDVSEATLQSLAASLQQIFGVPVIPHDPVDLPASNYDLERRQYSSSQILKSLARFKASLTQAERVLGVVAVDLYAADQNLSSEGPTPGRGWR